MSDSRCSETADERRRRRDRQNADAWSTWLAALPPEERARLAAMNLDGPGLEPEGAGGDRRGFAREESSVMFTEAFRDPADSAAASEVDAPVDRLEPELTANEYSEVQDAFARALLWSTQAANPAEMGRRLTVMLHVLRPGLLRGMAYEAEHAKEEELEEAIGDGNVGAVGKMYGAALEWMRRGKSLADFGQRVAALAYVMALGPLGALTLEQLAAPTNKTRQQFDKLVVDARDTFGGLRSRNMRDEEHRERCRRAQLAKTYQA
ncbi:MAG TPA: hypothetical protein VGO11_19760 [Chthoniobacteraceae bacterium]|nr:hypothetical protein [Chthoniobacteraceae bacterium]